MIFTNMSVALLDRRRELATFRAVGVSQRSLAALVTGENMLGLGREPRRDTWVRGPTLRP